MHYPSEEDKRIFAEFYADVRSWDRAKMEEIRRGLHEYISDENLEDFLAAGTEERIEMLSDWAIITGWFGWRVVPCTFEGKQKPLRVAEHSNKENYKLFISAAIVVQRCWVEDIDCFFEINGAVMTVRGLDEYQDVVNEYLEIHARYPKIFTSEQLRNRKIRRFRAGAGNRSPKIGNRVLSLVRDYQEGMISWHKAEAQIKELLVRESDG